MLGTPHIADELSNPRHGDAVRFQRTLLKSTIFGGIFCSLTGSAAKADPIVALTEQNSLIRFDSSAPGLLLGSNSITGLQSGERLLGIDFRPSNGELYGLSNDSRLFTLNPMTGRATFAVRLSTPLTTSSSYGIDFNPVDGQLRVVHSDARIDPTSNQNLRVNADNGAVVVDERLHPIRVVSPLDPNIGAASYTNNFFGATSTTLYDIDFFRDRLVLQNPENSGTLVRVGELAPSATPPIGGDITNQHVGFDISGISGIAFASLTSPTTDISSLYSVNLNTGAATDLGVIGDGLTVKSLAVPVTSPVPEPATAQLLGMGIASLGMLGLNQRMRNRKNE